MNKEYKKKGYSKRKVALVVSFVVFAIFLFAVSIVSFIQYTDKVERFEDYEALFVITLTSYDPITGETKESFYWKNNTPMPQKAQDCMANPNCQVEYDRIDS